MVSGADMGSEDDAGLWARVLGGDELALAALFDRYDGRLFRHASRLLTHREDAKDAVTVAFFELWRKRASVRLVEGSPLPWLLNTVAHCARNLERSGRRYRALLDRAPVSVAAPHDHDDSDVMAALRRLPEREQAVVVLSVLEGYAEREVAQVLGIPVGTVKSRLARAKTKLRGELGQEGARA
ncbi:DNA-directed RNA polymerase specialized sigma subunit, sigma24 homolog [Microbacterium testaceum StLB037]|uniref:DNA-directed RNA polymerase specialized sigma subunit, sigma24 homolog n=1 Tax=Microbacterium testaceum (strain StLB037) TaxID=979556 RepID=E8NAB0_MICTS|nr:DNA-directed RNA polymerase specialized sigma subunit, sigma24 homolog [Microbacterium testaceum StLB037]